MSLDHLTKKFMRVMKREVNTNMELDGKAGWREVKQNVASKFRLTSKDVNIITAALKRKKKLKLEKSRKSRIGLKF